jgi:serine-type D-Ala-D-Ala carboxypeptidase
MKNIEKKIYQLLLEAEQAGVFPGASVAIYLNTSKKPEKILLSSGNSQQYPRKIRISSRTIFDLASLSKPLSTVLSLISLVYSGKIAVEQKLKNLLPELVPEEKSEITILQLLNHSSGLPAYRPYYQQLAGIPGRERRAEMCRLIMAEPLENEPGTRGVYSDLGYLLLGYLVEKAAGAGLDQYFRQRVAAPLGLSPGIFYNRLPARRRGSYAATENCLWRGRVLRGEVGDENCWVLGGVAGHAGLFGRLGEVLALVAAVLEIWQGRQRQPFLPQGVLKGFLEAQSPVQGSTWALGFDRPTAGSSSSGRYLSPRSVGHLGFTGTSFWIDPERDLAIVLLTNRVHPSRDNNRIKEFRPYFHDRVIELLNLV